MVAEHPVVRSVREAISTQSLLPAREQGDGGVVEFDGAPAGACLDAELGGSAADVLQRPRDRESCAGRVEVGPLEAYNFAASHSGVGSEVQRRVQALHPGGGEESVKFGCGPGTCRWSFG